MLKQVMSLLLSLFYSKKESELVANQAMPSNNRIDISTVDSLTSWQTVATYTAPSAGIASMFGNAVKDNAFIQIIVGGNTLTHPSISGFSVNNQNPQIWLNVKKGDSLTFKANGLQNIKASFFKTVGGGVLALFKGVQYA